jgi:LmbE family N-acetylglucosaminyl deacetylase
MSVEDPLRLMQTMAAGGAVEATATLVAAHPDDETLGLGIGLSRFSRPTLIHLTDGVPRDPSHAERHGFADPAAYAEARRRELDAALKLLGLGGARRIGYGLVDQETALDLAALTRRLAENLAGQAVVITHPYEGGHPDHDAAAFAVQAACALLGAAAPARWEFAGYHLGAESPAVGAFAPDAASPEIEVLLTDEDRARRVSAAAVFESQVSTLRWLTAETERLRPAPTYDFTLPPPPARVMYDIWGWPLSSAAWREKAAEALVELDL